MKKLLYLIVVVFILQLTACLNPFKKYAEHFENVSWVSTPESEVDLTINSHFEYGYGLVVFKIDGKTHEFYGSISSSLVIRRKASAESYQAVFATKKSYLDKNKVYRSKVDIDKLFDGKLLGKSIVLEMVELDLKSISSKNFGSVSYTSTTLPLLKFEIIYEFGKGKGELVLSDEEVIEIVFYWVSDDLYKVTDESGNVLLSGTYINLLLDVVLQVDTCTLIPPVTKIILTGTN